jgi:hypothetical protein
MHSTKYKHGIVGSYDHGRAIKEMELVFKEIMEDRNMLSDKIRSRFSKYIVVEDLFAVRI